MKIVMEDGTDGEIGPGDARQLGGRKPRPEPWQVEHVDAATLSKRLEYRLPPAP
jgi:hypothetical protein